MSLSQRSVELSEPKECILGSASALKAYKLKITKIKHSIQLTKKNVVCDLSPFIYFL